MSPAVGKLPRVRRDVRRDRWTGVAVEWQGGVLIFAGTAAQRAAWLAGLRTCVSDVETFRALVLRESATRTRRR